MMLQQILATAKKDWQLVLKDSSAFTTLLLMPLVFIFVMSLAMSGMYSSGEDSSAPPLTVVVVNNDVGDAGAALLTQLRTVDGLELLEQYDGEVLTRARADALLNAQKEDIALIIPSNYSEMLRQAMFNNSTGAELELIVDPAVSSQFLMLVEGAIQGIGQQSAMMSMLPESLDTISTTLQGLGAIIPSSAMNTLKRDLVNPDSEGEAITDNQANANNLNNLISLKKTRPSDIPVMQRGPTAVEQNVPAYALFGIFFIAEVLALNLKREREDGTYRRLLVAPMARASLFLGKLLAFLSINLIQIILMFAVGVFILPLFGAPRLGLGLHPLGLLVISIAVSLAANALGLLIAAVTKSSSQVISVSLMLIIPMAVLGGVMVPRFVMPNFMQDLGRFSPHTWALDGYHEIILRGGTVMDIMPHSGVLLGFAMVFFVVALLRFRW